MDVHFHDPKQPFISPLSNGREESGGQYNRRDYLGCPLDLIYAVIFSRRATHISLYGVLQSMIYIHATDL